jgi:hypothetical protein
VNGSASDTKDMLLGTPPLEDSRRIGLALSGGGIRAAVFHLGVLRRLASEHLLENVSAISTVSGGSLIIAAIVSQAGMKWPSSEEYLGSTYPALRRRIVTADIFSLKAIGWAGLVEFNLLGRHRPPRRSARLPRVVDQHHLRREWQELAFFQARNG